jgi:hypothetical protein
LGGKAARSLLHLLGPVVARKGCESRDTLKISDFENAFPSRLELSNKEGEQWKLKDFQAFDSDSAGHHKR